MKKLSIACLILLSLLVTTVGFSQNYPSEYDGPSDDKYYEADDDDRAGNDRYSYEEFYDQLSPYGSWVNYPQYGYVWVPRVSQDFHPYATEGHWAMTNYGWTWVSDYRWGWAAFHYGRWAYEPRFGWMWLPGRKWGPAWVSWRESNDYFGWPPLGPFGRIAINVSCPNDHFRFVQRRYFTDRNVFRYYSDRRNNITIINHSRYINETHTVNKDKYFYGPRKDHVEHAVGQPIRVANVSTRQKPDADFSDNDNVKVYRPRFDNAPTDGHRASPKKVANVTEMADIPTDKRLTPNVRMEKPQNTEGGQSRDNRAGGQGRQPRKEEATQGRSDATRQELPNSEPRPQRQPRREEATQGRSDATRQELPNSEPRPQRQPRREEATQGRPNATRQELPNSEPRPQRQPRREETTQSRPDATRQELPNSEPRPQRQPRREETTQSRPDATRQELPNSEPRPQRQAQREESTQRSTPNNQQKVEQPRRERANPQPENEKQAAPKEKRNRERDN